MTKCADLVRVVSIEIERHRVQIRLITFVRSRVLFLRRLGVALLVSTLLGTIVPLGVSSHGQDCAMPCCADTEKSSGSCHISFDVPAKKVHAESDCDDKSGTARVEIVEPDQTIETDRSELCGADNLTGQSASLQLRVDAPRQITISSGAFSKPCSIDCAAVAVAFSQFRRSRDVVVASDRDELRLSFTALQFRNYQHPTFLSEQLRGRMPPRAPPVLLFNT